MHHFLNVGLYDALFIMQDTETETLWNHITGEGLYGELAGHRMPVSNLLQMNVGQALDMNSDIPVAISDRPIGGRPGGRSIGPENANAELMQEFSATIGGEDTRRPRMEMGLGIWTDETGRYYPVPTLRDEGRVLIDEFDGRKLLVYLDPSTSTPAAMFVDASAAEIEGRDIVLDNGQIVRSGVLLGADQKALPTDLPLQLFTRWYGFALTFPGPDIYGE